MERAKGEIFIKGGKGDPSSARHDAKRRESGSGHLRGALRGAAKPPPWAERGSGHPAQGREGRKEGGGERAGARVLGAAAAEPPALPSARLGASRALAGECPEAIL